MTTRFRLLRGNIVWVLRVYGFLPTKADSILCFKFLKVICIPMAGISRLFKDIPVILFGILVSDEF